MKEENEKKIMCTVLWNTTQYILLSCKEGLLAETYPTLFLPDTPPSPLTLSSTPSSSSYTPSSSSYTPSSSSYTPSPSSYTPVPSYAPSPSSYIPSPSSYTPSSSTPSHVDEPLSQYSPSSSINTLLNILSPSPHVDVHSQTNNTQSIYDSIIPGNSPSSVFTTPSSSSYNPDYHFLWLLLLIPLLFAGGCFYNRKYRNNSTVCPKINDKKYESDNAVNIEEGRKRNERNLSLPQESTETVKTRSESPHQYPSSPRRRRIGRRPKTLNIPPYNIPPPVVNSPRPRRIKSTQNSHPRHQHGLPRPRPRRIKSTQNSHIRPPSKTLPPTPGQPRPPTVPPRQTQPRPPVVPPRQKIDQSLVSI